MVRARWPSLLDVAIDHLDGPDDEDFAGIAGFDNPRKRAETLRRAPRRGKTATGMRQDGASPAQGVRRDRPIKPA